MKKILVALLMLVSTPTFAFQPSYLEQLHGCANQATIFAQFATLAGESSDADLPAFMAFVQQIMDNNASPVAKARIQELGQLAWKSRSDDDIHGNAMHVYDECVSHLGTKI